MTTVICEEEEKNQIVGEKVWLTTSKLYKHMYSLSLPAYKSTISDSSCISRDCVEQVSNQLRAIRFPIDRHENSIISMMTAD
jgi:hypothetical protein